MSRNKIPAWLIVGLVSINCSNAPHTNNDGGGDTGTGGDAFISYIGIGDASDVAVMDGSSDTCLGKSDGTDCSFMSAEGGVVRNVCLAGTCSPSSCGDRFVDPMAHEDCDDGNLVTGDGCEPGSCKFSCTMNSQCKDNNPCNGDETCNSSSHTCVPGTEPTDSTVCTRDGTNAGMGVCRGGGCVGSGCGNHVVEMGEECDDGNAIETDGCRSDCTFTCKTDVQCTDANLCNGNETCNTTMHTCVAGPPLNCDDHNACTADACDMTMGCRNILVDQDHDGHAPATAGACGDDCNDSDPTIYKGATEYCDGLDNNCNGTIDDGAVMATCFPDVDGDGYPTNTGGMSACRCPAGMIPARPDGKLDCFDNINQGSLVFPGQTNYFSSPYCTARYYYRGTPLCLNSSYDYNCDTTEEKQYTVISSSCGSSGTLLCSGSGWDSTTVSTAPNCGQSADYRSCGLRSCGTSKFTYFCCGGSVASQAQACR